MNKIIIRKNELFLALTLLLTNSVAGTVILNLNQKLENQNQQILELRTEFREIKDTFKATTADLLVMQKTAALQEKAVDVGTLVQTGNISIKSCLTLTGVILTLYLGFRTYKTLTGISVASLLPKLNILGSLPFFIQSKKLNFYSGDYSFELSMEGDEVQLLRAKHVNDEALKEINEFLTTVKNPVENTDHVGNIDISSNTAKTINTSISNLEPSETVNTSIFNLEPSEIADTMERSAEYANMVADIIP